jgi:hypothetical protein
VVEGADGVGEAGRVFLRHVMAGGRLPVFGEVRKVARMLGGRPGYADRMGTGCYRFAIWARLEPPWS